MQILLLRQYSLPHFFMLKNSFPSAQTNPNPWPINQFLSPVLTPNFQSNPDSPLSFIYMAMKKQRQYWELNS